MSFKFSALVVAVLGAFWISNESAHAGVDSQSQWQRPPLCNKIFKSYREAWRRCQSYGVNRRYDGWKFVGYGCDCSIYDERHTPSHPPGTDPIGWDHY